MSGPLQVERDVEVGRWIQAALAEDGTVAAVVPDVFEAYARVLHPASIAAPHPDGPDPRWGRQWSEARPLRWSRSAELLDRPFDEGMWMDGAGEQQVTLADGSLLSDPHQGDPPLDLLTAILETVLDEQGDDPVLAAVWEGAGLDPSATGVYAFSDELDPVEARRRSQELARRARLAMAERIDPQVRMAIDDHRVLGLPREGWGRGHVLLRGQLRALVDPAWVETAGLGWPDPEGDPAHFGSGRTPNLLWPSEPQGRPAWMVATDLDVDSTIVAGSARLVGRILADDRLEAVRALPSTRIA